MTNEILKFPFFISVHTFRDNKISLDTLSPWSCLNLRGTSFLNISGNCSFSIKQIDKKRFLISNQTKKEYKIDPRELSKSEIFDLFKVNYIKVEENLLSKSLF